MASSSPLARDRDAVIDVPRLSPRTLHSDGPSLQPESPTAVTPRRASDVYNALSLRFTRHWHTYALGDWLVALALYAVLGGIQLVSAHHRYIPDPQDAGINYPLMTETVPTSLLMVLAIVLPAILMILIFLMKRKTSPIALRELSSVLSGLLLATGMAALSTDIIKKAVGRPRPNFIQLCQWDFALKECSPSLSLSTVNNAYASFPSGHSSFSFSGLTFFALYLLTLVPHLRTARRRIIPAANAAAAAEILSSAQGPSLMPSDHAGSAPSRIALPAASGSKEAWVWLLCVSPVFLAGWISMTRIIDYWHWFDDVLTGCLLGFAIAHFVASFKLPPLQVALSNADAARATALQHPHAADYWHAYFGHHETHLPVCPTPSTGDDSGRDSRTNSAPPDRLTVVVTARSESR